MRIVLTNDDGYRAPGLLALWRAVRSLGFEEVTIIAPREVHSCRGHVVSDEVRVRREPLEPVGEILVVEGTPADCAIVSLYMEGIDRPDWLLAGVNRGSNLGVDQYNSGTVAAAREAAIHGVRAAAVSQLIRREQPDDWEETARRAAAVLAAILPSDWSPPDEESAKIYREALAAVRWWQDGFTGNRPGQLAAPCWNINLPRTPPGQWPAGVLPRVASPDPNRTRFQTVLHDDGGATVRYSGKYLQRPSAEGTDVHAVFQDYISISLLS